MDAPMPEVSRFARRPSPIMLLRVTDRLPEIQRGWAKIENMVGLRGHKFYGLINEETTEYLCCSNIRADDPPDRFGLELSELAGGDYLRLRLTGEPPAVYAQIGPHARYLHTFASADERRHDVEFYRRHDEIELWMPVLSGRTAASCVPCD